MKTRPTLVQEVAEASRVCTSEFVQARRDTSDIVASAKRLQRLQTKRARLRKELRQLEQDIKHERKMLRAIAGATR